MLHRLSHVIVLDGLKISEDRFLSCACLLSGFGAEDKDTEGV